MEEPADQGGYACDMLDMKRFQFWDQQGSSIHPSLSVSPG